MTDFLFKIFHEDFSKYLNFGNISFQKKLNLGCVDYYLGALMDKKTLALLLLLPPLILATGKIAFSADFVLPDHPPETEEERQAIEKRASEIALSNERVKRLMETKACNYTLQSNAFTSFHAEFISKEQIGEDSKGKPIYKEKYRHVWEGVLEASAVFIYDDYSKYFVHVDVTNGKIEYIGYIK